MTTQIDDIKKNMYLAITGYNNLTLLCPDCGHCLNLSSFSANFSGSPFKVLHISLPFIIVQGLDFKETLDARAYKFQKLNKEYVEAYKKYYLLEKKQRLDNSYNTTMCTGRNSIHNQQVTGE